jgi:transcriptional regulator NrdR family protein
MNTRFLNIDTINIDDYIEADVAALKLEDDVAELCSNDEGQFFLTYLVKNDEEYSIEWVEIFNTYDAAREFAEKLNSILCGESVAI